MAARLPRLPPSSPAAAKSWAALLARKHPRVPSQVFLGLFAPVPVNLRGVAWGLNKSRCLVARDLLRKGQISNEDFRRVIEGVLFEHQSKAAPLVADVLLSTKGLLDNSWLISMGLRLAHSEPSAARANAAFRAVP